MFKKILSSEAFRRKGTPRVYELFKVFFLSSLISVSLATLEFGRTIKLDITDVLLVGFIMFVSIDYFFKIRHPNAATELFSYLFLISMIWTNTIFITVVSVLLVVTYIVAYTKEFRRDKWH